MKELRLVTSKNCPLCIEALNIIKSLPIEDLKILKLDIFSSEDLHLNYWDKIPVLLYKDKNLNWPFNSESLKEFILDKPEE